MIYILTALKAEAQAFIEKFKLYPSHANHYISIHISGLGSQNMYLATKDIVKKLQKNDIIINVGICAAQKHYPIGTLLPQDVMLTCVDEPQEGCSEYEAVDMESKGFLQATQGIEKRYMFKVVSDHFQPKKVTKELTKQLIYNQIETILKAADA